MESTVMISSLLCNILIGCFCIVVLSWAVVAIQTVINDLPRRTTNTISSVWNP